VGNIKSEKRPEAIKKQLIQGFPRIPPWFRQKCLTLLRLPFIISNKAYRKNRIVIFYQLDANTYERSATLEVSGYTDAPITWSVFVYGLVGVPYIVVHICACK